MWLSRAATTWPYISDSHPGKKIPQILASCAHIIVLCAHIMCIMYAHEPVYEGTWRVLRAHMIALCAHNNIWRAHIIYIISLMSPPGLRGIIFRLQNKLSVCVSPLFHVHLIYLVVHIVCACSLRMRMLASWVDVSCLLGTH